METVMIRVSVVARDKLKAMSNGLSVAEVVDNLLSGVSERTDYDKIFDQLQMIHSRLDGLEQKPDDILTTYGKEPEETPQEKFLRIKAEQEAVAKYQKEAVAHPEDFPEW